MSAVRRFDGRSQARKAQSSPYARPQSSVWSIRKLLEPIRRRVFGGTAESEEDANGQQIERSPSPRKAGPPEESSYASILTYQSSAQEPPRSPSQSVSPRRPPPTAGQTLRATLENVLEWLADATGSTLRREEVDILVNLIHQSIPSEQTVTSSLLHSVGRPLGAIEVEGMASLLRKQMPRERSEPFRFESATPTRESTPIATPSRPKTLTKNPNGTYRWQGAGSSKVGARRNRYASPAFGTPGVTPEKTKAAKGTAVNDSTAADGKRRKLDNEKPSFFPPVPSSQPTSSPSKALPFPISSPGGNSRPTTNGGTSPPKITIQPAPPAPQPRLRTPTFTKPTTPSQPSPLRNAWTGSPDTSLEDISQSDRSNGDISPPKPTQAASFMSELIKEVTPAKKPDLSNPYQTASPVAKVGPPRRSTRRTRTTRPPVPTAPEKKAEEKKEEETKDLPPEAIFEATLPKGSKRSRPPANLEISTPRRSPSPLTNGNGAHMADYTVEEVDEDDRLSKKKKGLNGLASPPSRSSDVEVEEVDESQASSAEETPSGGSVFGGIAITNGPPPRPSFSGFKPTAVPSRPSKLRYSYQADSSAPSSPTSQVEAEATSTSATMDLDVPPPPTFNTTFSFSSTAAPKAPPPVPPPVPSAGFSPTSVQSTPTPLDPKAQALSRPIENLPIFAMAAITPVPAKDSFAAEKAKSKTVAELRIFDFSPSVLEAGPSKPAASGGFNWAAAGIKPPTSSETSWTCSMCSLSNPTSVKDKCTVCDAPRPGAQAEAPKPSAFNWAAAGMKPPASSSSKWVCSTCRLDNPDSAKEKCTVCDAPRLGGASEAPKSSGSFSWAAAGMKPPASSPSQWTCSACSLANPDSAKEKCTVCDATRPGVKAEAPKPSASFNWAAAGINPPPVGSTSEWTCSLCGLKNPISASKCTVCDNLRSW